MSDVQEPSFGSSHIDSPREVAPSRPFRRPRQEILESDAFRLRFGDRVRDRLGDLDCAVLAVYLDTPDWLAAGRYLADLLRPVMNGVVEDIRRDDADRGRAVTT